MNRLVMNNRFNRDTRVIYARKQYRENLKLGMKETEAWDIANAIYAQVRWEASNVGLG